MRVAAVALMHRDSQESRETKVFTVMHVQTPELRMPGNLITIRKTESYMSSCSQNLLLGT
jgi:hypothetical protein